MFSRRGFAPSLLFNHCLHMHFLTYDSFTFQKEILQGVGEDRVLHQRQTAPWMRQFRDYNNSLFQTITGVMRA